MSRRNAERLWTVRDLLEWSTVYLQRHGVDSPRVTAELLLGKALSCSRVDLFLRYDQPLEADERAAYRALLKRRSKREPTHYILGKRPFWSLELAVDPRVLIPRPETERLLEEAVRLFEQGKLDRKGPFLDLCTGSGALACALAVEFPEAEIDATDISADALAVAKTNATQLEVGERVRFFEGDLFAALPPKKYALIVSNPPYIRTDELDGLQPEVRLFEPRLALDGGADGLDIVRKILRQAPDFLAPEGVLLIEIGAEQGPAAKALALESAAYFEVKILRDYAQKDRILWCEL